MRTFHTPVSEISQPAGPKPTQTAPVLNSLFYKLDVLNVANQAQVWRSTQRFVKIVTYSLFSINRIFYIIDQYFCKMYPPSNPHFAAYMRFLRLSSALKSSQNALSVHELALFEEIVLAWAQDRPLSVSQAIGLERLGAHATLFKRLAALRKRRLVKAVKGETDVRIKFMVPTKKGIAYIGQFAQALTHCREP